MVGSLEADIEDACNRPDDIDEVVNDLDMEDDEVAVEYTEVIKLNNFNSNQYIFYFFTFDKMNY